MTDTSFAEMLMRVLEHSPATRIAHRLVTELGREHAHRALDVALKKFTVVELAALGMHWAFWARPKQIAPDGAWRWWGQLGGRGGGKTKGIGPYIAQEAEAGRAMSIGLAAQDEANSVALQVLGPSGLIASSPPWFRPIWRASDLELHWPNGARAYVRTPEVPGKIRGFDYHLSWLTEIQSWPAKTMHEAFMNFELSTRIGYGRLIWDATPKRGHALLLRFLAEAKEDPERHRLVRCTTYENWINLSDGYVEDLERKLGGTQQGREELLGEMLTESERALVQQTWIDDHRRHRPDKILRRVLGVDPAITSRRGSDRTGIVDAGEGIDHQVLVLGDYSGKFTPPEWAKIVLDKYLEGRCDLVVVETNRGGDLVVQNLRAAAAARGLSVVVVGKDERPVHQAGVIFVKEVHARGPKQDRSQPLATAYERGRISHVLGVDLTSLETTLTTWEPSEARPGERSPDDLDALTHAALELLGVRDGHPSPERTMRGVDKANQELRAALLGRPSTVQSLLRRGRVGRI